MNHIFCLLALVSQIVIQVYDNSSEEALYYDKFGTDKNDSEDIIINCLKKFFGTIQSSRVNDPLPSLTFRNNAPSETEETTIFLIQEQGGENSTTAVTAENATEQDVPNGTMFEQTLVVVNELPNTNTDKSEGLVLLGIISVGGLIITVLAVMALALLIARKIWNVYRKRRLTVAHQTELRLEDTGVTSGPIGDQSDSEEIKEEETKL